MDRNEQMGDMLNAIGQHLVDIIGGHPDGAYLYVEAGEGFVAPSLFHDVGDRVINLDLSDELVDELLGLWDVTETDKKWVVLQYAVKDGKFDARFSYPDEVDLDDLDIDWRERALVERYGDKPVIYPDPDEHFRDLTEADLSHLNDKD